MGVLARAPRYVTTAFSPTSLAGLKFWVDASDASTITESAGSVSQWDDKSGGALHVTQATGANRPTTGAATQNSLNVISFDSTDTLDRTGTSICGSAYSIFFVFRKTGGANSFECAPITLTSTFLGKPIDGYNTSRFVDDGGFGTYTNLKTQTSWCQISWVATAGTPNSFQEWKDATSVSSGTVTRTWATSSQQITLASRADGATKLTGDVAEIVVYDVALGTTDRQLVEAYLKAKWATP